MLFFFNKRNQQFILRAVIPNIYKYYNANRKITFIISQHLMSHSEYAVQNNI